jgi:hypothetical protein
MIRAFYWRWYRWLYWKLYPTYECKLCIGQEPWRGCWCAYHGAWSPDDQDGIEAPWWARIGRRFIKPETYGDNNA